MGARIVLIPPGAAAGQYALQECASGAAPTPATTLVLLPTHRHVSELSQRLIERSALPALLAPPIYTFPELARRILLTARPHVVPLGGIRARLLLRDVVAHVAEEHGLKYLERALESPGYLDALAELIDEFKRAAVDPRPEVAGEALSARFARAGLTDDRTREIVAIYEHYQDELNRRDWYDEPGLFWAACEEIKNGNLRALDGIQALIVDGFWDFTTTQLNLLELLAHHTLDAAITLPLNVPDGQAGLFEPVQAARRELKRRLPEAAEIVAPVEPDERAPALRSIVSRLLVADVPAPCLDEEAVQILECPSRGREALEIARLCKDLVLSGRAAPDDIMIVFRNLADQGDQAAHALEAAGVPYYLHGRAAASCGLMRAVETLLSLPAQDYPRQALVVLLRSNYVDATLGDLSAPDPDAIDRLTREANIVRGRANYARRLAAWRERTADGETAEEIGQVAAHIERLLTKIEQCLPPQATWPRYARGLLELIDFFQLDCHVTCPSATRHAAKDIAALNALIAQLQGIAADPQALPDEIDRGTFLRDLRGLLTAEDEPQDGRPEGRVLLTDAYSARGLRRPVVIIAGLTEDAFPAQRRTGPFYDDAERRRLAEAGVPLQTSDERQAAEPLLFLGAVAAASQRLVLTYPAAGPRGEQILTSHYVQAVADTLNPPPQPQVISISQVIPEPRHITTLVQCMEWALAEAQTDRCKVLRQALANLDKRQSAPAPHALDALASALAGWKVESDRVSDNPLGPYDGVLTDSQLLEDLASRFGQQHLFSHNQLDTYLTSPFQFFAGEVLRIQPLPEPLETMDGLTRGNLYHTIMFRYFTEGTDLEWKRLSQLIDEVFDDPRGDAAYLEPALRQIEKEECRKSLRLWLAIEQQRLAQTDLQPHLHEVCYGDPGSKVKPLRVEAEGQVVLLRGRIDRIDLDPSGKRFAVYDYKHRMPSNSGQTVAPDAALQLIIYALAARDIILRSPNTEWVEAAFCYLARPPAFVPVRSRGMSMDDILAQGRDTIGQCASAIRQGRFGVNADPAPCSAYCPYILACRCDRYRVPRKVGGEGGE